MKERRFLALIAVVTIAVLIIGYAGVRWVAASRDQPAEETYQGTELDGRQAPDFRLVDHRGQPVSFGDFRRKVVVLTFLDALCVDVCPLIALALRDVHEELQQENPSLVNEVAFLAINVSHDALRPEDVAAFTERNRLEELTTWHFLTGSLEELNPLWSAYGISHSPPGSVAHSVATFVIDRQGRERWVSTQGLPAPLSESLAREIRRLLREKP